MKVRDIIAATAAVGGVTAEELVSRIRRRDLVLLRQLGMLLSSRLTTSSWNMIGQVWAGRDRTTAAHAAAFGAALLDGGDQTARLQMAAIIHLLKIKSLPVARPAALQVRRRPATIRAEILSMQARLRALRVELRAAEGDAP